MVRPAARGVAPGWFVMALQAVGADERPQPGMTDLLVAAEVPVGPLLLSNSSPENLEQNEAPVMHIPVPATVLLPWFLLDS